jgi:ParB family chromosome partitioning protein
VAVEKHKRLRLEYPLIEQIDISDSNVRKSDIERDIEELADSIREIGLQHPVIVCKKKDGRYELISGQRRYYACKSLGWTRIPAFIRTVSDQTQAIIISLSENIQRLDIPYRNKMQAATVLLARLGNIKDVAKRIGVSEQTVVNYLGYAAVPDEVKTMVDDNKIGATTALEITKKNYPDTKRIIA